MDSPTVYGLVGVTCVVCSSVQCPEEVGVYSQYMFVGEEVCVAIAMFFWVVVVLVAMVQVCGVACPHC